MSPRASDIATEALREALIRHGQIETALRQRVAALEAEVKALHLEIDRLRCRPHPDRDIATDALEKS